MAKLYAKAPDGSDALLSIVITGFTQSLQQNGWCKLPNGLLFQWGNPFVNGDSVYDWTFPIGYSSACYTGSAALSTNIVGGIDVGKDQNTGFKPLSKFQARTSNNGPWCNVYLIAIGY